MVDLVVLQSLSYTAGAISVVLGVIYYAINLREQKQTRQFQMLMQLSQHDFSKEGKIDHLEWQKMEWKDYNDFLRKYDSSVNIESFAIRDVKAGQYGLLGILVERGIINRDLMYDWAGENAIMDWRKYREIALAQRKEFNRPQVAANWEYLYGEMVKVAKARGVEVEKFATKF